MSYNLDFDFVIDKLPHRVEHELKEIENKNHIETRWQPASCEFLDVLKSINASERQRIKGKLLGVVKERVFYLNALAHHAGWCIIFNTVAQCVILVIVC